MSASTEPNWSKFGVQKVVKDKNLIERGENDDYVCVSLLARRDGSALHWAVGASPPNPGSNASPRLIVEVDPDARPWFRSLPDAQDKLEATLDVTFVVKMVKNPKTNQVSISLITPGGDPGGKI